MSFPAQDIKDSLSLLNHFMPGNLCLSFLNVITCKFSFIAQILIYCHVNLVIFSLEYDVLSYCYQTLSDTTSPHPDHDLRNMNPNYLKMLPQKLQLFLPIGFEKISLYILNILKKRSDPLPKKMMKKNMGPNLTPGNHDLNRFKYTLNQGAPTQVTVVLADLDF